VVERVRLAVARVAEYAHALDKLVVVGRVGLAAFFFSNLKIK
jgi:hypothetical protein